MSAQHSYAGAIIANAHTAVARLIADISAPMAGSTALRVGAGGGATVRALHRGRQSNELCRGLGQMVWFFPSCWLQCFHGSSRFWAPSIRFCGLRVVSFPPPPFGLGPMTQGP